MAPQPTGEISARRRGRGGVGGLPHSQPHTGSDPFAAFMAAFRATMRDELAPVVRALEKGAAQAHAEKSDRRRGREAPGGEPDDHIDIVKLTARLGKDRSTISRWCRAGTFPAAHYCGQLRCWRRSEVEAWEEGRRTAQHPRRPTP